MAKNTAYELAKEYGFETKEEYFDYIVDSYINGQNSQMKDLFNQMEDDSKEEFKSYLSGFAASFEVKILRRLL